MKIDMSTALARPAPASMILCSLVVAVLAACGGGAGGAAPATATTPADAGTGSGASAEAGTGTGTGAGAGAETGAPVDSSTSGSADDVIVELPNDPGVLLADNSPGADASLSALAVKATSTVAVEVAQESRSFQLAGTMTVRFGLGTAWTTKTVSDSGNCTIAFFGSDPAPGKLKVCQVLVSASAATGATVASAGMPAPENATFYVFGKRSVQYGFGGTNVTKEVTGRGECSNAFFGKDPIAGVTKRCKFAPLPGTVVPIVAPVALAGSLMPVVDLKKVPDPETGFSSARVGPANVAEPGQNPVASDIGDFREYCEFSHMSYADPIAAPGGLSGHLHTFLGNTGTNANSTSTSIAGTGNSTCAGGTLNRTAYWVPTVIDTTDGTPQVPMGSLIYYKQNYNYVTAASIRPFPAGLRIVAGNSGSSVSQDGIASFTCAKPDGTLATSKSIPTNCPSGSTLTIGVGFPQCWDGVNLDSPDHKSHMAYPGIGCPASHPVPLTGISFNINYKVGINGTARWRLSSDNYDRGLPGGYSSHADWMNGWNPDTMNTWTTRCINAQMDCHAFLIGDGRILY